jgi:WD40 repeat protein
MAPSKLTHISDLTPPSLERTWLTTPHPTLPIVATCSSDKTVRIYSLTNFTLLSTITGGHKRSVRTAAWKPHITGESVLATGSFDATVGIWRRWDSYGTTDTTPTTTNTTTTDASEDDHGDDSDEEWRFAVLLDGHDSEVKSISWSPSGLLLATCARDKSIWIWEDLDDGDNNFETVAVMQEHGGDVKCVSWHPVEECLASAGYDDTIRVWREDLDDWGQVACIKGHSGTVWFLDWEGVDTCPTTSSSTAAPQELSSQWRSQRSLSGPRLVSCSDDRTARIWRRVPKESANSALSSAQTGIPSIIRPSGTDEEWVEDSCLPHAHELAIYAVAWSRRTGIVASVGADGRIVLYEERFIAQEGGTVNSADADADAEAMDTSDDATPALLRTEWSIVAVVDGAHGIYEINHAAWAKRADRGSGGEEEEVLVTTADDGSVKVWGFQR